MDNTDLPNVILTIIIVGLILFIGISAVSAVIDSGESTGTEQTAALLDGTQWTVIDDIVGYSETVYDSRGYAVKLAGQSNSYIQSETKLQVAQDETWTVSLWASRNTTTENMTALTVGNNLVVTYNATKGNWTAWYYDAGSRNSYRIEKSPEGPASNLENVQVIRNGTILTIYANTTAGESTSLTNSSIVDAPINATNWDGKLEEIRLSDDAWNSSVRSSHFNNPIDPLKINHSGRVMFDEPYRNTQRFFYASGDIQTSNVEFDSGLPGQKLASDSNLLGQTDYKWRDNGPEIRAIAGGELDGAPVAYVDYESKGIVSGLIDDWNAAVGLAGILLILLPVGTIFLYLSSTRGR